MIRLPIKLRADIIDPSVFDPFVHIGADVRKRGDGISDAFRSLRSFLALSRPYSARADAEHDTSRTDAVNRLYQFVHVRPPPIVARLTVFVLFIRLSVVDLRGILVRIKIIVEMSKRI